MSEYQHRIRVGEGRNQNTGQLFPAVEVRFCCVLLWVSVDVVAFTSFSLTTHRNNSKTDDFH